MVDKISADPESVQRLVGRFEDPKRVWACYEAGPTGYELARLFRIRRIHCEVIAPALIPVTSRGRRVKTDTRDAASLARLFRAGQLSSVRVPTRAEEGVRDLCRARRDMIADRTRARHRLGALLLRHGHVWRDGSNWTLKHQAWIRAQRLDDPAAQRTLVHYLATVDARDAEVDAIETDLQEWLRRPPFADAVARLVAYRGIDYHGALTLASEVCDWRRFPTAARFMGFTGLVPSESSSGDRQVRGGITHAGNVHLRTQLVESAWAYRHGPYVGKMMARRHNDLDPVVTRAWKAQLRLCGKFRRLDARKNTRNTVVAAVARELAGFVWAEMTA